jgi:formate dehydrogenase major subunit
MESYLGRMPETGWWGNKRAYLVSMMKSWFGDAATAENDFCFDHLPRITGDHGTYRTTLDMIDRTVKGYFLLGQNPAVGSAGGRLQRLALANLDWLVVKDLTLLESATFWLNGPEIESGELVTERIGTEVFFLPAASHVEKEGSFTNTQRLLQWHAKALDPPGDARSDLGFIYQLGKLIKARLAGSADPADRPILDLTWDYPEDDLGDPSAEAVLAELNGFDASGAPLSSFLSLADDGSTACGSWIHAGVYADGVNQSNRRRPWTEQSWVAPEWGWAWPANTTGPRPTPRASLGAMPRPTSGGTAMPASGPDTTCRTSRGRRRRASCPNPEPRPRRRWAEPTPSSCRPTARRPCSYPRVSPTGRCRSTSRQPNHRYATGSTGKTPARCPYSTGTGGRRTPR